MGEPRPMVEGALPVPSASYPADSGREPIPARSERPAERTGVLVVAITLALVAIPMALSAMVLGRAPGAFRFDNLGLIASATTSLVAAGAAAIAWGLYRESGRIDALYQSAASLVIATTGVLVILTSVTHGHFHHDGAAYAWLLTLLVAVTLLVAAPVAAAFGRRMTPPARDAVIAVLPALLSAMATLALVTGAAAELAPPGVIQEALVDDTGHHTLYVSPPSHPWALLLAFPTVILAAFGAFSFARLYRGHGGRGYAYVSIGLILAAGCVLAFALVPIAHPDWATLSDLLLVGFCLALMTGAMSDSRATLRRANVQIRGLLDTQLDATKTAIVDERARIARALHDSVIQSLWVARVRQDDLLSARLRPSDRAIAQSVAKVLDDAMAEARDTTAILAPREAGETIDTVLERSVARFADRLGLDARFTAQGTRGRLDPLIEIELVSIIREAMTNVAKHARSASVRVRLGSDGDSLVLLVGDNGVGFDPSVKGEGFGLRSMRERAAVIGARLDVLGRPGAGTLVVLTVPIRGRPDRG